MLFLRGKCYFNYFCGHSSVGFALFIIGLYQNILSIAIDVLPTWCIKMPPTCIPTYTLLFVRTSSWKRNIFFPAPVGGWGISKRITDPCFILNCQFVVSCVHLRALHLVSRLLMTLQKFSLFIGEEDGTIHCLCCRKWGQMSDVKNCVSMLNLIIFCLFTFYLERAMHYWLLIKLIF